MGLVGALSVFLVLWNNTANLVAAYRRWYVPVNIALAAGLLAAGRASGMTWDEMGLRAATLPAGLGWGGAVAAVVAAGLGVVLAVPRLRPLLRDARLAGWANRRVAVYAAVRIPLGTVALEEVAFRGVLLAAWAEVAGVPAAVVGSSVVFGLWHVVPSALAVTANRPGARPAVVAGAVLGAVVVTAAAGVGLCLLRLASGSLAAPAAAHVATNSLAAMASTIAWRADRAAMLDGP